MAQGPLGEGHLVIASHNTGKVQEIAELLHPYGIIVYPADEMGVEEPEESGDTFAENAEIKAVTTAKQSDLPALADDSGLCVTALEGKPGLHSARWGGPDKDFRVAMDRVNRELGDVQDRSAEFVCALCLAWPDGATRIYEGRVKGELVWPPRGEHGFGYDPIFVPEGCALTFAEMDPKEKHAISHRARAFAKLVADLFED